MKKLWICLTLLLFAMTFKGGAVPTFAEDGEIGENYVVYNEDDEVLIEKSAVEEGDTFITKDFYEYKVHKLEGHKGYAKRIGRINVPEIKRDDLNKYGISLFNNIRETDYKKICMYMTHNDESYRPSDGYDSVYGVGGVHDVAKAFKSQLEGKGISVVLNETLHIPHDSNAYTRSNSTANKLFSSEYPDAMFDIHRDGVSKSFYYTKQDGKDLSKIRIVVGKSNPYFDDNYKFAQTVFAIGNSMYPWLFSDIYCGKGHYNQAFMPTALLFEMGTYLIEKEYVYNTLPYLAEVVNTALYQSKTEENGDITVDESVSETAQSPVVDPEPYDQPRDNGLAIGLGITIPILVLGGGTVAYCLYYKSQSDKKNKK